MGTTKGKVKMQQKMELTSGMPVQFGKVHAMIFGGPFAEYVPGQRRLASVKMAVEIDHPHDIDIPTKDFNVPHLDDMHAGIDKALQYILDGNDIYVGCYGGIGRTGLFMACMAKVMMQYAEDTGNPFVVDQRILDAYPKVSPIVAYVRGTYFAHAVEKPIQHEFIDSFKVRQHVEWLMAELEPKVIRVPEVVVRTVEKRVNVEVPVPVYYWNPLRALSAWWGRKTSV